MESLPLTIKNIELTESGESSHSRVSSINKQTEKCTEKEGLEKHLKRYIKDCKYLI